MQTLLHLKELDLFVWVDEMGYIETLPKYKLRKNGRKDNRRGKIIKPAKDRYGYLRATLKKTTKGKVIMFIDWLLWHICLIMMINYK